MEFLDTLSRQLVNAEEQMAMNRRRKRQARTVFTALGVAAAAAVYTAVSFGGPRQLPIFKVATADASQVKASLKNANMSLDYANAHQISTPNGPGYVIADSSKTHACIVVPDSVPDSYGSTCAPIGQIESRGLQIELIADAPTTPSVLTMVLPQGATSVTWRSGSKLDSVMPRAGVVSLSTTQDAVLSWRVGGRKHSYAFTAHPPASATTWYDCGGGRIIEVRTGTDPKEACR